ncbi:hypothetical protein ACWG0P_05970 [Amedibacillus sp. YH-ame6]
MKIYFNFTEAFKEVYFDKMICFHGNIDNQNKLYDVMINGLNGSDRSFLLNNTSVKKKELNIIEFSSNSILDDLKMTSKSYNLKILESIIDNEDNGVLEENINDILEAYEKKIIDKYALLTNDGSVLFEPRLKVESIKDVIISNFKLVSKEDLNISKEVELQLRVILHYVSMNSNHEFYLLIKHFDHCLDIEQMKSIVLKIEEIENLHVVIFSKSFEIFEHFSNKAMTNYMIKDRIVSKPFEYNSPETFEYSILSTKEKDRFKRVSDLLLRYRNYIEIVSEKNKKQENYDEI